MVLDEETVLRGIRAHLEALRTDAETRAAEAARAEAAAR